MMSQVDLWLTRLFHNFSKNIIFHLQILFHFDLPNIFPSSTFVWTLSQFYIKAFTTKKGKKMQCPQMFEAVTIKATEIRAQI